MNHKIQNLKTFAILSVVLGHSVIIYGGWNLIHTSVESDFFYSVCHFVGVYEMELYFFISGFLLYFSEKRCGSYSIILKKKVKRLLLPYFLFGIIWMIPLKIAVSLPGYTFDSLGIVLWDFILGKKSGHLWFLYALFWIFLFASIIKKSKIVSSKKGCYLILLISLFLYLRTPSFDWFCLSKALHFLFWFELGYLYNNYKKIFDYSCLILSLFYFVRLDFYYALACPFLYLLIEYMPNRKIPLLEKITFHSFGIYLIHSPFVYITFTYLSDFHPLFVFIVNFIFFGFISYVLSLLYKKSWLNSRVKI